MMTENDERGGCKEGGKERYIKRGKKEKSRERERERERERAREREQTCTCKNSGCYFEIPVHPKPMFLKEILNAKPRP